MIDFHSHILPCMDDGSRSVDESIGMLKSLSEQGIETVVATPHFYANDESVSDFIARRQSSLEMLEESLTPDLPQILTGAEVKYYEGISRMPDLKSLCIQGTHILLIEMPMRRWTEYVVKELVDISCSGNVTVLLAHVDRYLKFQHSGIAEYLLANDIMMQMNAEYICNFATRHKALGLLKKHTIHVLGSDCHNMTDRRPDIGKAYEVIRKKFGNDFLIGFNDFGKNFLSDI
ncbi:MAG: capsular polysaccharide biosynthesis protein [Ruminococcaceae bacterium]|nr:capsular polysaccharide biosynthesis protein [Oscillospiraceae bacterium]